MGILSRLFKGIAILLSAVLCIFTWVTLYLLYTAPNPARTSKDWVPVLLSEILTPFLLLLLALIALGIWGMGHHPKKSPIQSTGPSSHVCREKPGSHHDAPNHNLRNKARVGFVIVLLGTCASGLPVMFASATLSPDPAASFAEVWGPAWEDSIHRSTRGPWHDAPWSFWDFIFGSAVDASTYEFIRHVPYEIIDANNTLHTDIYRPRPRASASPSAPIDPPSFPIIINLHGGSWTYGDKGYFNIMPTSQYLAAQGYLVFDVQYGAENEEGIQDQATILEEIRHIADFTRWIAEPTQVAAYGGDIAQVFVMGRSAGAHLAGVTALGWSNASWGAKNVQFATNVTVCGGILYYPPTDFTRRNYTQTELSAGELTRDLTPTDVSLISPIRLITPTSVPLLILQGRDDSLVKVGTVRTFQQTLRASGVKSVYLEFPYADHGFDAHPGGVATQISLWATERYLQLALQEAA